MYRETQWSTCTLSGQPLREPVVADFLGSLYNREVVLEFLLARSGLLVDDESEVGPHGHCRLLQLTYFSVIWTI